MDVPEGALLAVEDLSIELVSLSVHPTDITSAHTRGPVITAGVAIYSMLRRQKLAFPHTELKSQRSLSI